MPATRHRSRRPPLGASAHQGQTRPQAAVGNQADEATMLRRSKSRATRSRRTTLGCSRFEWAMRTHPRRTLMKAGRSAAARPARRAQPAPPRPRITPELIAAAKKEGKVIWYTAVDLPVAERSPRPSRPSIRACPSRVERSGGERIFQRIGQEYASKIHAVDVVNSSDAAHFIVWKRDGLLAPFVPEDVANHYPAEHRDPDGLHASWRVSVRDRLQHQAGEAGGRAQELCRPARSQVVGQDRQGAIPATAAPS